MKHTADEINAKTKEKFSLNEKINAKAELVEYSLPPERLLRIDDLLSYMDAITFGTLKK